MREPSPLLLKKKTANPTINRKGRRFGASILKCQQDKVLAGAAALRATMLGLEGVRRVFF
jgi:hypothetical protein